jgi:hypothetical protein
MCEMTRWLFVPGPDGLADGDHAQCEFAFDPDIDGDLLEYYYSLAAVGL